MLAAYRLFAESLSQLPSGKRLISTLNAHSYNVARRDPAFCEALQRSDILLPDGISIVLALRWLTGQRLAKIAGEDLFFFEMARLQAEGGTAFFLGSSEATLARICERAGRDYPAVAVETYSPPFKPEFSPEEDQAMLECINACRPSVLFVGLTAPKQEKWAFRHKEQLQVGHICCIGAVFDFYAGTVRRAPRWMVRLGLEWLYRLLAEPRRMWRRYLVGNIVFIGAVIREKLGLRDASGN